MTTYLLVGLGAAVGAILRYDITKAIKNRISGYFPLATLLINLSGAFILGVFAGMFVSSSNQYLLLGTGLCGGFTTFSTMSYETAILFREKRGGLALIYQAISISAGLLFVAGGFFLTHH